VEPADAAMTPRPSPTTTLATIGVVLAATLPFREVFGSWVWAPTVVGASIVAALVATALETPRPGLPVPTVTLITGAAVWGVLVSLGDEFWSAPGSGAVWGSLLDGLLDGWGALLDEEFPLTNPQEAETFVGILVWIAAAAAVHVAARRHTALAAVLSGAVVLAVSTAAALPRGLPPVVLGSLAGVLALTAIATVARLPEQRWRFGRMIALVALMGVAGGVAALAGVGAESLDRPPADPRATRGTETLDFLVPDVLAEFAVRRTGAGTVLTIDSATPPSGLRLRLQVYDSHDGERWLPAGDFEAVDAFPGVGELPPGDLVTLTVRLRDLDGPWIPLPDRLVDIDVEDVGWNDDAQTMVATEQPTTYQVTGSRVDRTDLEGLESARDEVPERLRQVPAALPDSIRQAAMAAAADTTDAVSAIDAITRRVREIGRDDRVAPGSSIARLESDLRAEATTGAEQIASLHGLMLRTVGIPSRIVVGYVADGAVVEADDLHVWVEAAFPSLGWIAFDPVPPATETSTETPDDPTVTTTVPPDDAPLQARALPRELGPGEDPDEPEIGVDDSFTREDWINLGIALAVATVLGLFAARAIRRRVRQARSWRPDVRVLCAWAEFVDRLREVGAPITATTTTGDVVYMAGEMDEELGELARDLADAASAAMHGPDDPVADDADAAWALLEQAEARLVVTNGRFSQSRRYYDPRVLRHRAPLPPGSRGGGHRSEVTAP